MISPIAPAIASVLLASVLLQGAPSSVENPQEGAAVDIEILDRHPETSDRPVPPSATPSLEPVPDRRGEAGSGSSTLPPGAVLAASSWITALATVVLAVLTGVLAFFTWRLYSQAAQPQVVANLEPSKWSFIHLDLHVKNTGTATAFDIRVAFDPPLPRAKNVNEPPSTDAPSPDFEPPLSQLSLLKPGQAISSFQCAAAHALNNSYAVTVTWSRRPSSVRREKLEYVLNLAGIANLERLGEESPEVQTAKELRSIREKWEPIARGSKRLRVDSYSSLDRARERAKQEEIWEGQRAAREAEQPQAVASREEN